MNILDSLGRDYEWSVQGSELIEENPIPSSYNVNATRKS